MPNWVRWLLGSVWAVVLVLGIFSAGSYWGSDGKSPQSDIDVSDYVGHVPSGASTNGADHRGTRVPRNAQERLDGARTCLQNAGIGSGDFRLRLNESKPGGYQVDVRESIRRTSVLLQGVNRCADQHEFKQFTALSIRRY